MSYLAGDGRVFLNRNKQLYDLILVDAFHGGYVPFHLLTKEFYALVKQRLAPGGAAAFNVHDGTKLYVSTIKTLDEVFPSLHLYPTGEGEVIAVATAQPAPATTTLRGQRRGTAAAPQLPLSAAAALLERRMTDDAAIAVRQGRAAHRRFRAGQSLRRDRAATAAPEAEDSLTPSPARCADRRRWRSGPRRSSWHRADSPSAA